MNSTKISKKQSTVWLKNDQSIPAAGSVVLIPLGTWQDLQHPPCNILVWARGPSLSTCFLSNTGVHGPVLGQHKSLNYSCSSTSLEEDEAKKDFPVSSDCSPANQSLKFCLQSSLMIFILKFCILYENHLDIDTVNYNLIF
jgi:hypothetical protein